MKTPTVLSIFFGNFVKNNTMKLLIIIFSLCSGMLFSQRDSEKPIPGKVFPIAITTLQNSVQNQKSSTQKIRNVKFSLPDYSGGKAIYNLTENDLTAERASSITTFNGVSADGSSKLKLSLFEDHFVAIVKNKEGYFYIEPYQTAAGYYRIYPAFADFGVNFTCDNGHDAELMKELNAVKNNLMAKSATNFPYGTQLRKFRMAIATTGEFTQTFAGDQNLALAEAVSMLNLINLIYESEVSITFTVIAKTTDKTLIFTDPNTDPFTVDPTFASATNSQTGFTLMNTNGTLDFSLYDIGHTFHLISTPGAQGQAGNQPCNSISKARAWSQWNLSLPKATTANLIVHEMGHQFSAGHTYNAYGGNSGNPSFCTNGWSSTAAVEPGAGTTIMSYGNNCFTPYDYTNSGDNKLNYFNAKSLDQIIANLTGAGNCFVAQATANLPPTANAGSDITIPKNTPFKLKGAGSDPNDTNLSYTWEQADIATVNDFGSFGDAIVGAGGYPASNSPESAPLFRSEQSTTSMERTFPKMEYVLTYQNKPPKNRAEVLPTVARTMKFRFTVRDNNISSGGVDSDEMIVTVAATGPLEVTYPSATGISIPALAPTTITWAENGTSAQKSTVNIMLSIDGGNTYPYLLAADTPNDGSESVLIPNVQNTTTARIKVVAVLSADAEFFDVSNSNFSIVSSCAAFKTYISPNTNVAASVGSVESNLNMSAPPAVGNGYNSKIVNYNTATNNNVLTYNDASNTTPKLVITNFPSVTYSFRVGATGSYVFSKSGAFLVLTIHSGSPFTTSNFVASNTNFDGTNYQSYGVTQSMILQEGVTYHAMLSNFSNPANALSYTINKTTGPGMLYDIVTPPAGFNYTFVAIDVSNQKIVALSPTADFSTLPAGTYNVYGMSYDDTLGTSTFINKTIFELTNTSACFTLSQNSRELQLSGTLGTGEYVAISNDITIAPNPVDNYLTVKSKLKITDYQIFDLSGRLIDGNVFKSNTINVSSLKTGTYIISLLSNEKVLHQEKLIKK